jgi:hypothetical protein
MRPGARHHRITHRRESADELFVFGALLVAVCLLAGAGLFAALTLSRFF